MSRFTILFLALCFGVSAINSPADASDGQQDPSGLLRVSSNLFMAMEEQDVNNVDDGGPSNNNAPKEVVVVEDDPVQASSAEKKAALKYLFRKNNRNNPDLRELSSRVNIGPLALLLRTLRHGGQMTANQLNKRVVDEKVTSYKLCQKHKANGFIQYDEANLLWSLTPKGQFVLETLEEHLKTHATSQKKHARIEDRDEDEIQKDDDEPFKPKRKVHRPTPLKKPRQFTAKDSIESVVARFVRPEAHLNILSAMGDTGEYKNARAIFDNMAEKILKGPWEKVQYAFRDHYLKVSLNHGWLISKRTGEDEIYALTETGVEARQALETRMTRLPKKASVVEVEEVVDEEEEWASYSLSSYEPAKEKRGRTSPSDVDDDQEDEEDNPRVESQKKTLKVNSLLIRRKNLATPNQSAPVVAAKKATPAPKKPAAPAPARKAAEPEQPTQTLDTLPEPLRNHLIDQVMNDASVDLKELEAVIFQGIFDQFSKVLIEKFGIGPGNALKEEVEKSYTFSIKKK